MTEISNARRLMLTQTLIAYIAIFGLATISGMKVALYPAVMFPVFIVVFMIVCNTIAMRLKMDTLRNTTDAVNCGLLLTIPVITSTYLAMKTNLPLADNTLAALDRSLGLNWFAIIRWIDDRPSLSAAFTFAYRSFSYQLFLLPIILVWAGRVARSYQMVAGYGLICFISSAISIFYPAEGTYVAYGIEPGTLKNIDTFYVFGFLEEFHAVRSDPNFIFDIQKAFGILTFPSVHTAVAVLCAWAAWDIRLLRYPLLLLNILMALSTIPEASHYVVDVIAGAGVAGCSIALICWITRAGSHMPANRQFGAAQHDVDADIGQVSRTLRSAAENA